MVPTRAFELAVDQTAVPPPCPNCGQSMHLDRVVRRAGGLSDLSFKCEECWVIEEATSDTGGGFLPKPFGARWRGE